MSDHLFKDVTINEKVGVFEESSTNKIVSFKPMQKELLKALLLSKSSYNACVNHQASKTEINKINDKELIHNKFYSFGELYGALKTYAEIEKSHGTNYISSGTVALYMKQTSLRLYYTD